MRYGAILNTVVVEKPCSRLRRRNGRESASYVRLSIVLVAAALPCVAACGGEEKPTSSSGAASATSPPTQATNGKEWGITPAGAEAYLEEDHSHWLDWGDGYATGIEDDVTCLGQAAGSFRKRGTSYFTHLRCSVSGHDVDTGEPQLVRIAFQMVGQNAPSSRWTIAGDPYDRHIP
jgi:hypothetical protein